MHINTYSPPKKEGKLTALHREDALFLLSWPEKNYKLNDDRFHYDLWSFPDTNLCRILSRIQSSALEPIKILTDMSF